MGAVGVELGVTKLLREVVKRDGRRADFDAGKIRSALLRAAQATNEFGEAEADLLTARWSRC